MQEEVTIPAGTSLRVRIYRSNNIKVYCGYDRPQNTDNDFFLMWTNASKATGQQQQIEYGDRVGNGCSKISDCGLVGDCDFCQQKCYCWPGKGGSDNYKNTGSMDCTQFECPEGPRWGSACRSRRRTAATSRRPWPVPVSKSSSAPDALHAIEQASRRWRGRQRDEFSTVKF